MEIILAPEQEAKLAELAARQGRRTDDLVQEALARDLEDGAHFVAAGIKGLASLDRGEVMTHAEIGRRADRRLKS